ncbi:M4 family metallopeptidase [Mucilaginibacter sp. FT3.2]|uniref:M4 family metallopeptidase n=1 Tax=Mucilaginibacter sp. FT3.2 TaxID=2723090 RepID=UPI001619C824|nr:M4 family metallopeptidase [Mucilaginibacter sp. FT3.2]MBB6229938.1 Zn-dependent metalloprotease [Mucilaginibacter sp. FT3.2]
MSCKCNIIPKYVKDILVVDGFLDNQIMTGSLEIDKFFRLQKTQRSLKLISGFATAPATGTAARTICNCKNTKTFHKHVVIKEGGPNVADPDANLAYEYAGVVRDYYKNVLGRNSLDNNGLNLEFNIHYDKAYDNAFWNGEVMVFGDGDGHMFDHFVKGLDVIGHELTHGVVQYTAGLTDDEFPGTLNEHVADVFGTVIKQYHKGQNAQTADWLIGDEIVLPAFPGKALRSMKAPGTAFNNDPQPDNMANYKPWNGDPHLNNGIPNRAFYLVAAGGAAIHGLDTPLAGKLWYQALLILKPNSNFKDLYNAVHQKATDMATASVLPANAAAVVDNAFKTVGII